MAKLPTKLQFSAGGVAYRKLDGKTCIAVISVGEAGRWQLPKGLIDKNESPEAAAMREVREEAGIETEPVGLIDKIDYWYVADERGERIRFHKFVYFYLLKYLSGDVGDHDSEVNEARWVEIGKALEMLGFASEKKMVERAIQMIAD